MGQYSSNRVPPVSSPPISARAVTDWFLDSAVNGKPNGFTNPRTPLGSLALLLSELPDGERSSYGTAIVPRATFANVQKAVHAWILRGRTHPKNFLFLFVVSHGECFGRRTAFLLEDYGTNDFNVTAGISEVEQFVEALANVDPEQQLLIIDCCRTPPSLGLRFDQQFGMPLINLERGSNWLGRRAHVLRSTGLGAEALGQKGAPTLFTKALLEALRGLAASPNDDWVVDTYALGRTVSGLIGLYGRSVERVQQPDSQLGAPFVITTTPPVETATVFVSLGSGIDFSRCRIRVTDGERLVAEIVGSDGSPPFARLELPKYKRHTIAAFGEGGELIGKTQIEPLPPVAFKELPDPLSLTQASGSRSLGVGKGQFVVIVERNNDLTHFGLVVTLNPRAGTRKARTAITLWAREPSSAIEVEAGWYTIGIAGPDGRTSFCEAEIKAGVRLTLRYEPPQRTTRSDGPSSDSRAEVLNGHHAETEKSGGI